MNEQVRFAISGMIGTCLFYGLYELMFYGWAYFPLADRLSGVKGALIWTASYLLSILWQMELHARLVYQIKISNYFQTLMKTYLAYLLSIVVSSLLSFLLSDTLGWNTTLVWSVSVGLTGVLNWFTVGAAMKSTEKTVEKKTN